MLTTWGAKLHEWVALYGCRSYYHLHVSGHFPMADLISVIEAARHGALIPIPTRHPETFVSLHDGVESHIQLDRPFTLR